jgi:hypothetical protein
MYRNITNKNIITPKTESTTKKTQNHQTTKAKTKIKQKTHKNHSIETCMALDS